ncbi:hypothetical protein COO91_09285 (plasmid) [Nostoc flagelliforme CCNUN1]|uniref:Uncharacterized protein n=1 Tax=Nostoc flagelliforme CCNUN1 TaxID=2038116 RepID=A0A2K8T5Z7_9NOSO|nr:hypothetical protein COO91_09285 [Nostoc flagelliforme CCNUN1]
MQSLRFYHSLFICLLFDCIAKTASDRSHTLIGLFCVFY